MLNLTKTYTPAAGQKSSAAGYNTDMSALFNALTGLENQTKTLGGLTITPSSDAEKFIVSDAAGTVRLSIDTSTGIFKVCKSDGTDALKVNTSTGRVDGGVPSGVILMWSGLISAIPSGWKLCDGTNGTPNLCDKFILGVASSAQDPGSTGGSHTATLASNNLPSHTHYVYARQSGGTPANPVITKGASNIGGGTVQTDGVTDGGYGLNGDAFTIDPPYYKLAYIMKI